MGRDCGFDDRKQCGCRPCRTRLVKYIDAVALLVRHCRVIAVHTGRGGLHLKALHPDFFSLIIDVGSAILAVFQDVSAKIHIADEAAFLHFFFPHDVIARILVIPEILKQANAGRN